MSMSWGSVIKGAKVAAGVIAGAAVVSMAFGGSREYQAPSAAEQQMDRESFAMKIENDRMEALMAARMQAVGMAEGVGGRGA